MPDILCCPYRSASPFRGYISKFPSPLASGWAQLMESTSRRSKGSRRQRLVYLLPSLPPHWPGWGNKYTASSLAVSLLTFWLYSLQLPLLSVPSVSCWDPDRYKNIFSFYRVQEVYTSFFNVRKICYLFLKFSLYYTSKHVNIGGSEIAGK